LLVVVVLRNLAARRSLENTGASTHECVKTICPMWRSTIKANRTISTFWGRTDDRQKNSHLYNHFLFVFLQSKNPSLAGQSFTGKNSLRPEPGPLFGGDFFFLNNN
jgi:hypothetical protein